MAIQKVIIKYNGTVLSEVTSAATKKLLTSGKLLNGNIEVEVQASRLPSGYTEVEYIQDSGSQWIDTEYTPTTNTTATIDFMMLSHTSSQETWIYASWNGASNSCRCGISSSNTWDTSYGFSYSTTYALNTRVIGTCKGIYNCSYSAYLFAQHESDGTYHLRDSKRLYSCKIYDSSALIRNFVPCINSSSVAGLYDLANGKFYTNKGSGTFTPGPEVS